MAQCEISRERRALKRAALSPDTAAPPCADFGVYVGSVKLSQVFDDWIRSDPGQECVNALTLGLRHSNAEHLRARLQRAFRAGVAADRAGLV